MLLEAILKYTERAGLTEEATAIQSAFRVMQKTPKAANEMMDVGRLQGFEVLTDFLCNVESCVLKNCNYFYRHFSFYS
jgi:hypothetical protein